MKKLTLSIMLALFACVTAIKASCDGDLCQQMTALFDRARTQTLQNGHSTVTTKITIPGPLTYPALSACAKQYHQKNPVINNWDYNLNVNLEEKDITLFMSTQPIKHFLQTKK